MTSAAPLLRPVELTDLLWSFDPVTGERRPVHLAAVLTRLAAGGQTRACRLAMSLPVYAGVLDEAAIDALMFRIHAELQRLGEELQLPRRIAEALRSWAKPLLQQSDAPVRVVDVGCGLGYVTRWLAAHQVLGPRVELVAILGATAAAWVDRDLVVAAVAFAAVAAVLAVEQVAGRRFGGDQALAES